MGKLSCKDRCNRPNFPTAMIKTAKRTRSKNSKRRTAANYNYKHREQGLAKCNNCDYITSKPVEQGTRCKCCGVLLSRSIYHKGAAEKQNHKFIE